MKIYLLLEESRREGRVGERGGGVEEGGGEGTEKKQQH
jgi:hypothetical protein